MMVAALITDMTTISISPSNFHSATERSLDDPMTERFNVRRLQHGIFIRGWTTEEFALEVTWGRSSVFKALRGEPVRPRHPKRDARGCGGTAGGARL
jgi:hypothetical protein